MFHGEASDAKSRELHASFAQRLESDVSAVITRVA